VNIPGFEDPNIVGVILRYYLFRPLAGTKTKAEIEALYQQKKTNPVTLEIAGSFAPLFAGEQILTTPTGRLMISNQPQIPTPLGSQNNSANGLFALAPGVLQVNENIVSADFVGTFPDNYQPQPQPPSNAKYDFGNVSLVVYSDSNSAVIGPVEYARTAEGDQRGWIFDFDIS